MHSSHQPEEMQQARMARIMRGRRLASVILAVVATLVVQSIAGSVSAQHTGQFNQLLYNQVQYNDSAASQTPRLAQPQTLTPVRSYAPAPYPTTGAAIIQPDYLKPADELAAAPQATKMGPTAPLPSVPLGAQPLAEPKQLAGQRKAVQAPPPVAANQPASKKPVERSGFRQFVLGPDDTTPKNTQAAPAAPQREHYAATLPPATPANNSLWNQFIGHSGQSQPQPTQPSQPKTQPQSRVANTAPLPATANPLQLAAAEESNTWWPYPRPSLKDIQDSKTPAVSATITVSGGLPPANAQSTTAATAPPTQSSAPNTTGIPPVPTVPGMTHSEMSSAAYGLWDSVKMTNDGPVAPMPVGENVRKTAQNKTNQTEERWDVDTVPGLLKPFYATNGSPSNGRSRSSSTSNTSQPTSITEALIASPLGRQLSMESDEDLRTSGLASIEAETKPNEPWDGTVTVQWPLMSNPFVMSEAAQPSPVPPSSVSQVAFMQEPLPAPSNGSTSNDDAGDAKSLAGDDDDKDKKDTLVGAETLGNAPDDNTLAFLRTQTVLLAPGKHQFDIGLEYTITENDFPILRDAGGGAVFVDNVEFKARELTVPMELRYGLLPRVQGFLQLPVGWSNVQAAFDNYDEYENDGGVGDIGFGLTAQLRDAYKDCPYIIGTIAGLAPTGGDPFGVVGQITPNAPSLGNGFWAISGNLLWVQTRYDPVVLYYGLGARYQFEHEYFNVEFQPGMEYNYTLGCGFAVNERVTLSTQFFGAYIEELKANGERVEGTIQEPMNLRVAATLAKPCNRLVEPFCTFGLTDDAISSNIGITWTY